MKALLLIDMPDSCGDCPFRIRWNPDDIKCMANGEVFEETFNSLMYVRKNKCPLKPMNDKALKISNKDFIIYQRDYLMANLDREISLWKSAKEYEELEK